MSDSGRSKDPVDAGVRMQFGVKIPLRDGVHLNATLYLPEEHATPTPAIFTLTPYIGQTYHDVGMNFAAYGWPFLTVDVRGRGNSEGAFRPFIQEAKDGHDVVEWLARQPYCNGKVAMWGGSYSGGNQWAAAEEFPSHLATIVPVASPFFGVDVPIRGNITTPYWMRWLTLLWGRTAQDKLFWNQERFWGTVYDRFSRSGRPFKEIDTWFGAPSPTLQEWLAHPCQDEYWDSYNPTSAQYEKIDIPILSITGSYDADQPGALMHYREHLRNATIEGRARHFLVIGPWDHAGTRAPQEAFAGITCGPASLVDLGRLHREWYGWTMQGGPKPEFLQKNVAYYVMGAEKWRYADTLDAVTSAHRPLFLDSHGSASRIFASGDLRDAIGNGGPDMYVYDPRDVGDSAHEGAESDSPSVLAPFPLDDVTDQTEVFAKDGKQLVYHSAPFERDTEISGFFKLTAWIAIDQPDTDFLISIYQIGNDGGSIFLTSDLLRARYRESLREERLIRTTKSLRYDFECFTFISRLVRKGCRLRLTIGPVNSIHYQKNYNSGGVVAAETMKDARPVTVKVFHDAQRTSVLHVPLGQPE